MDIKTLYSQFMKGAKYFNEQYAKGSRNPVVLRQVTDFERQVVNPMDAACQRLTAEQRKELEYDYIPF